MKKFLMAAVLIGLVSGCTTTPTKDERAVIVDGQIEKVKVIDIASFQIEVDPNKAVCSIPTTDGNMIEGECIQYRQLFQRNYSTTSSPIQGFTFEPGYRYILDVRQEAVLNESTGVVEPVWILNKIVSKNPELLLPKG